MNINNLTEAELERLAILAEECGEVLQVIGKILRHGYESYHPENPLVTNRLLLEKEVGDVHVAFELLLKNDDLNGCGVVTRITEKRESIKKYLHHQ